MVDPAARDRAKDLRREINAGADPLDNRKQVREAPRFKDLIERYVEEYPPHLSPPMAARHSDLAMLYERGLEICRQR